MLRFIGRRFIFIGTILLFIVFAVNLGMLMARNSEVSEPNYDLVVQGKQAWRETKAFVNNALEGDFGEIESGERSMPISGLVLEAYRNSMVLLAFAMGVAAIVGIAIGILAALRKKLSLSLLTLTIIGISVPSFFIALLLQQGVIAYTRTHGQILSVAGFGWDYQHMLLPVFVLAVRPLAYLTRNSFTSLGQTMEEDYVRTARAKGLHKHQIINVHAMRNIAIPVFTAIGVSLRFSLSTLPVVEYFFAWPGIGYLLINAINNRQTPLVVILALILGLTILVVNLILDVLYRIVDPRMREES